MIIGRLLQLEDLIAEKSTGPLEELAEKMEMSIELTKAYIESLEELRDCKIDYSPEYSSFVFKTPC
ncbi:hypothetical protein C900_02329 [Fulvivirga imtechensis AK7]|uniref:HTH domain-containing protein n=1 Tax=Fulvivirga imtechensis AK7 TaxID=1237149 RepID=L8JVX8_9BACT|nr:hypothetical protein [Fulvivirga imtechensis]ELR71744.1 hypothetical protein C900_02329 [Fulvivirga imtechensis AK7]